MKVFKNLKSKIKKNDTITNAGIIFVLAFIVPTLIAVICDVFTNGSKML
tara:strand:- start:265 stop:411 length:147 start_codon:yes stop_codon:yes gene_type:complete